jgi:hypothetical protein
MISEGNHVYKGTSCEHTWFIYHDHLKIWWEKESQTYIKSLKCPIEDNPSRTWPSEKAHMWFVTSRCDEPHKNVLRTIGP